LFRAHNRQILIGVTAALLVLMSSTRRHTTLA
jgi:hypothetical protein